MNFDKIGPDAWGEETWNTKHQPFYYLLAPGDVLLGVFTKAKEVLDRARPGLRVMCQLGYSEERTQVWPPTRRDDGPSATR